MILSEESDLREKERVATPRLKGSTLGELQKIMSRVEKPVGIIAAMKGEGV